jgi:hypothetical protein
MIARPVQMHEGFAWPGPAGMNFLVAAIPMKWVAPPETQFLERDEVGGLLPRRARRQCTLGESRHQGD